MAKITLTKEDRELCCDDDIRYSIIKRAMEGLKSSEKPKTQDEDLEKYLIGR